MIVLEIEYVVKVFTGDVSGAGTGINNLSFNFDLFFNKINHFRCKCLFNYAWVIWR